MYLTQYMYYTALVEIEKYVGWELLGKAGTCLASLPGVYLLFYIPVILLLIIMCFIFMLFVCHQTVIINVSCTLSKRNWIELNKWLLLETKQNALPYKNIGVYHFASRTEIGDNIATMLYYDIQNI